jgi:2-amino-4-hydroxy-6-hydroxymethyldihydropteridine diphosphokinase
VSHRVYLSLGANLAEPAQTVVRAFVALGRIGTVVRRSRLYRSQPWGSTDQPEFVNAAALLETDRAPRELLHALQTIETSLGRKPRERWGPRELDLDILTYDDDAIDEPELHVPHPHMHERAFVLVPLAEIDPAYERMRDALPPAERAGVSPMEEPLP